MRKIWKLFWLFCAAAFVMTVYIDKTVQAAADSLAVKAGFYGGPYYEVVVFSDGDMRSMSDGYVWTYSGVDSGGFMRLCYAWGVSLDFLLDQAGIDLTSVGYLHMGTEDNYEEYYATFSADNLLRERYFYPQMVRLAAFDGRKEQTLPLDALTGEEQADAQPVPAMLAIGCTEFSRAAYTDAAWNGYADYDRTELSEDLKYRLIYGQLGLDSLDAALNVQESDKWVFEINVQLTGAPGIVLERSLLEGVEDEVGSRYRLDVSVDFPPGYGYLSGEILENLTNQVLERLEVSYDDSVINLVCTGAGQYEMEIVGEGQADLNVSYARQEYDGTWVNASQSMTVSGRAPAPSQTPIPNDWEKEDVSEEMPTVLPTKIPEKVSENQNEEIAPPKTDSNEEGSKVRQQEAAGEAPRLGLAEKYSESPKNSRKETKTDDEALEAETAAVKDASEQTETTETKESSQQWMGVPADALENISDSGIRSDIGFTDENPPSKGVAAAAALLFLLGIVESAAGFYAERKGERG